MSRINDDVLTSIPVNSTMQDLNDFSLLESDNDHIYPNYDYEDDDTESEFNEDDDDENNETYEKTNFFTTYHDSKSTNRNKINRTDDLKEMTNITRINNSQKRTLKSFQEKYPTSVELPNMLQYYSSSNNSLNSYSDENTQQQNDYRKSINKQDIKLFYQELNTIHNKLVVFILRYFFI